MTKVTIRFEGEKSYPAIATQPGSHYGTLLGWYATEEEANAAVKQFQEAKPISFEELMGIRREKQT